MTEQDANAPGRSIRAHLPDPIARTDQHLVVDADADTTYRAIWSADFTEAPLARLLAAVAVWPQRIASRARGEPMPPSGARHDGLREALADDSPWVLLADETGVEVVLGLLWTPPAGGIKRPAAEFHAFDEPGVAKVAWAMTVTPFGPDRSLLTTETRTATNDAQTRRRFLVLWWIIAPFAALLRRQVLLAIKAEAEHHDARA